MTPTCPHCGANLPSTGDAFCPECFTALDELPGAVSSPQRENRPSTSSGFDIVGAESLNWDELKDEIESGGRLIVYKYCISIGVLTFLQSSKVHLVRAGESALFKGLRYTFLSMLVGWWGIPWGFIHTPVAIVTNLSGGKDVTEHVVDNFT